MSDWTDAERLDHIYDAIESAAWGWERLSGATTLSETASAFDQVNNAISDLQTWHPRFNYETGEIEELNVGP